MMAFAGLAEEDCFDAAAGAKRFFDEADAFDADGAGLRGKTAAERHAEFFEPAIVAAGEDSGHGCARCGTSGFAGGGHCRQGNKFTREGVMVLSETRGRGLITVICGDAKVWTAIARERGVW